MSTIAWVFEYTACPHTERLVHNPVSVLANAGVRVSEDRRRDRRAIVTIESGILTNRAHIQPEAEQLQSLPFTWFIPSD